MFLCMEAQDAHSTFNYTLTVKQLIDKENFLLQADQNTVHMLSSSWAHLDACPLVGAGWMERSPYG